MAEEERTVPLVIYENGVRHIVGSAVIRDGVISAVVEPKQESLIGTIQGNSSISFSIDRNETLTPEEYHVGAFGGDKRTAKPVPRNPTAAEQGVITKLYDKLVRQGKVLPNQPQHRQK